MNLQSALYVGSVVHHRLRPKAHRLRYRIFSLLLDLDELPELPRRLRFLSVGRFNLFGVDPRDYLSGKTDDLRGEIDAILRGAGIEPDGGAIRLLTMPRILGFAFNPLSLFFCHAADGGLRAIIYEVNNTFGQRHCYLFPIENAERRSFAHACDKAFYVSPFMGMEMSYAFRVTTPEDDFTLAIAVSDAEGPMMNAAQRLQNVALDDAALLRVFFTHPLLTLKVVAGIHFEALLIWLKGVGLHMRPPPPERLVTVVAKEQTEEGRVSCRI